MGGSRRKEKSRVGRSRAANIAEVLRRELGAARVIDGPAQRLADDYGSDHSGLGPFRPDCAALCESGDQVAIVLRLAREHRIPITPRGAGTGKSGGALPVRGGITLCTRGMNRILDIDRDDLVAVAEPGVVLLDLQDAVEEQGLFYPPDPASLDTCCLGGNVAENAGGPRAFRYGVTREYVLGLEVGLIGGNRERLGRRSAKGVTGYDMVAGFVGSEGTFGVATEITVKLIPKPSATATMLAVFRSSRAAIDAITGLLAIGLWPSALELIDRSTLEHLPADNDLALPRETGAIAIIEIDGEPEGMAVAIRRAADLCAQRGALDVTVASDERARSEIWGARRACSEALRDAFPHKLSEDICVPRGAIAQMLRRLDQTAASFDTPIATYGHAGDGNLHVNLLCDHDPAGTPTERRIQAAAREIFSDTIALGGTLSGEHGIGLAKRDHLHLEQSPRLIGWERELKRIWDPDGLMNPGKIFPDDGRP